MVQSQNLTNLAPWDRPWRVRDSAEVAALARVAPEHKIRFVRRGHAGPHHLRPLPALQLADVRNLTRSVLRRYTLTNTRAVVPRRQWVAAQR
jgi:hypothetical protein